MSVVDVIRHYQRSIEKCSDDGQRMLHCLHKLFRLPVTVQHLKETGIGRTVNALRHHDGEVGDAAKTTVLKWKAMVAAEESSDGEGTGSPSEQVEEVRQNPKQDKEERLKDKSKSSKTKEDRSRSERHREEKRKDSKHKTESHNHKPEASVDQRKYDKHKVNKDNEKQDHKSEKEKSSKESYSSSRKSKETCKSEDKHSSSRHSHKRKHKDSSIDERKEDKKRRKQELERSSDEEENPEDDSDSKEMQMNEHVYDEEYVPCSISRTQEQNEESDSSNSSEAEVYSKENRSRNSSSNYSNGNSYKRHTSEQNHDVPRKHQKHKERSSGEERVHKSESEKTYSSSSSSKTNSYKQKEKGTDSKDHKRSKSDTQKIEVKKEKTELVEKSKLKHEKTKTNDTNSSSKKSKEKELSNEKPSKEKSNKKIKLKTIDDEGISSHSGASFAEALGMVDPIVKKRSSGTNSVSKTPRPSSGKSIGTHDNSDIKTKEPSNKLPKPVSFVIEEPPLLPPPIKLEPLDVDLDATLPEINPNYKPLPHINPDLFSRRSKMSDDEALSRVMSTKNQRTKVYSGVKSNKSWATTPSLFDICVRVLQENIDALEYTGGVPYDLLKPVLNHATPEQLLVLEHYNPYLVEDTDELWEFHCKKRFRTKVREDMETWREMFMRCSDEQEARLKALTTNISQTMKQSTPVRQTKLAYVEGVVKPPRNVAKQQAKYGTARMSSSKTSPIKSPKPSASSSTTTSVPPPPRAVPTAKVKHRMAPLMQKTMKLAKSFKR